MDLLYENGVNYCQTVEVIDNSVSWDPLTGSSWTYYINSGDYKVNVEGDTVVVYILVAGVSKKEIKAFIEDKVLSVSTTKPGWNGNVNVEVDLSYYKVNMKEPKVKLSNGVLRIEFPKIDEKVHLEIK